MLPRVSLMNKLFLAIRASLFYLVYVLMLIWFSVSGALLLSFFPYRIRSHYILYWNKLAMAWLRIICGIRFTVQGAENLSGGPYVFLSKHQSSWETIFLQYFLSPVCVVLKHELLYLPFFGWGLKLTDPIAIDRGSPKKALKQTMEQGAERLARGISVLIFPEGTRIDPGQKGKYARGGTNIATKSNAAIIPIAHNAGECWPSDKFLKFPGTITVVIGKPIETSGRESRELTAEIEQWIENEMEKMAPTPA